MKSPYQQPLKVWDIETKTNATGIYLLRGWRRCWGTANIEAWYSVMRLVKWIKGRVNVLGV